MLDAAKAFIVRTTDWRSPALLIFRRRLSTVTLMTSPWPPQWAPWECLAWTRHLGRVGLTIPVWRRIWAQTRVWDCARPSLPDSARLRLSASARVEKERALCGRLR